MELAIKEEDKLSIESAKLAEIYAQMVNKNIDTRAEGYFKADNLPG